MLADVFLRGIWDNLIEIHERTKTYQWNIKQFCLFHHELFFQNLNGGNIKRFETRRANKITNKTSKTLSEILVKSFETWLDVFKNYFRISVKFFLLIFECCVTRFRFWGGIETVKLMLITRKNHFWIKLVWSEKSLPRHCDLGSLQEHP